MKTPSIARLKSVFNDNAKEAKRILLLADWADLGPMRDNLGLHRSAAKWQVKMEALNRLAETHGVETIALGDGSFVDYLNAGDTYATTLYRWNGNYYVGDWGSLVERHESMDLQEAIAANGYRQH